MTTDGDPSVDLPFPEDREAEDHVSRAEALWGKPDDQGRHLAYVVEHGDDASEEDYSFVGNMLLAAIDQAVRDYGYDFNIYSQSRYYRYITSEFSNPLVAKLADGTLVAARSTSRPGPGSSRTIRKPTSQEHARWAGLPIPPEPPPQPTPEPSLIDIVWSRLVQHEGASFTTTRGRAFTYHAYSSNLWLRKPDGSGTSIERRMIYAALNEWPAPGPTALSVNCGHKQRTYIWALLADPRIMGL